MSTWGWRANYRRTIEACRGRYVADVRRRRLVVRSRSNCRRQVEAVGGRSRLRVELYARSERLVRDDGPQRRRYPARRAHFADFDRLLFDNDGRELHDAVARRELILRGTTTEVRPAEHPEWLTDDAPMWIWFAACSRIRASEEVTAVHRHVARKRQPEYGLTVQRIAFCDSLMRHLRSGSTPATARGATCGRCVGVGVRVALWVLVARRYDRRSILSRWWRDVAALRRCLVF